MSHVVSLAWQHAEMIAWHEEAFLVRLANEPQRRALRGSIALNCRKVGTSIEDPPGLRESKLGTMHLAYVRDPDGNKLCALHRPK